MKFTHVTLRVIQARSAEYEQSFLALRELTLANEPGCRVFELCRDPEQAGLYHIFEAYDDDAAIEIHAAAPYYAAFAKAFLAFIEGDHMEEIERRGLAGRAMFAVVKNIRFDRYVTI